MWRSANHRTVRSEASGVLGAMAKTVGKGLAPYLKALAGSWWLAQFDLHSEAAAAARDAFQAAFAGQKQKEALLFTRTEVRVHHRDMPDSSEVAMPYQHHLAHTGYPVMHMECVCMPGNYHVMSCHLNATWWNT